MNKLSPADLYSLERYARERPAIRTSVLEHKRDRQIHVGPNATWLFEDRITVQYQVQEMLRTERITKEAAILHELETYNELVPGDGELSATMFVEIPDADTRERRLSELAGLEGTIALEVLGTKIAARNETRGVLPDRTTAVHYIKFPLGRDLAVSLIARERNVEGAMFFIVEHPKLTLRQEVPAITVRNLAHDLME